MSSGPATSTVLAARSSGTAASRASVDQALAVEEAERQLLVVAGRPHRHRERRAVDADLERLLDGDLVARSPSWLTRPVHPRVGFIHLAQHRQARCYLPVRVHGEAKRAGSSDRASSRRCALCAAQRPPRTPARLHRLELRAGRLPLERAAEPARELPRRLATAASTGRSARCTGASTTVVPFCDDNNVFSLTYLRVTEDIRNGIHEGFYPDQDWINYLDAIFARTYFLAYDNYMAGRIDLVPPAWRIAFDAGRDESVKGIGNLLLSMNAHVNRDFPFVLYQAGVTRKDGSSRKDEHDSGNGRLRALYKPMIDRADRALRRVDRRLRPPRHDRRRRGALQRPGRLARDRLAERAPARGRQGRRRAPSRSRQSIEEYAVTTARAIYAGSAYAPGESDAPRDARCTLNGGQDDSYNRGSDVADVRLPQGDPARGPDVHLRGRVPRRPGALRRRGRSCRGTKKGTRFNVPAGKERNFSLLLPGQEGRRQQDQDEAPLGAGPGGRRDQAAQAPSQGRVTPLALRKPTKLPTPSNWASWKPLGIGEQRPNNYREVFRTIWENRDNAGYAWRILNEGVCDGCALGTKGLRDWTIDGVHLCNVRLRLLRLNTMGPLDASRPRRRRAAAEAPRRRPPRARPAARADAPPPRRARLLPGLLGRGARPHHRADPRVRRRALRLLS